MLMAADNIFSNSDRNTDRTAGRDRVPVVCAGDLEHAVELLTEAEVLRVQAAELVGRLAESGLAEWLGYVSMERLIAHRTGRRNTDARVFVEVARFLDRHQVSAAAVRDGGLSWANAQTLARVAVRGRGDVFTEHEADLVAAAGGRSPEEFDRLVHAWRSRVDRESDTEDAERSWNERSLTMQLAFDGSSRGQFRLDPVSTEIVAAALETPPDPEHTLAEPRSLAQRRADALVELCQPGNIGTGGGGLRASVDVVVDIETLAAGEQLTVARLRQELGRGGPIGGPGLDRLLCDASFRALVTDGKRVVLAYNRATPDIPPALRRAVRVRDQHCTFTGCDRPHYWCDLHHIIPRNRGGPTTAENLTLLCRFHHGTVHEGGWQLTRAPDGTIHITRP